MRCENDCHQNSDPTNCDDNYRQNADPKNCDNDFRRNFEDQVDVENKSVKCSKFCEIFFLVL